MGVIECKGYSFVQCDQLGCVNRTNPLFGDKNGLPLVRAVAKQKGWKFVEERKLYATEVTEIATCPDCVWLQS